jgi:hypothetical protein
LSPLLSEVLEAHGGLAKWRGFERLSTTIISGGEFWAIKGLTQDPAPRRMTIEIHHEWASVQPFGNPNWRTAFTPDRIAIETLSGETVSERFSPREMFANHTFTTPWDPLHRAYFNGYALWTYLTAPFLLAEPGFEVEEIAPLQESGETWRGLRARFPDGVASHSREQDFYFGDDGLVRRHDYNVDVAGGFAGAQLVSNYIEVDGLRFPTRRRAYVRGADHRPQLDRVMVSIDLSEFSLS